MVFTHKIVLTNIYPYMLCPSLGGGKLAFLVFLQYV